MATTTLPTPKQGFQLDKVFKIALGNLWHNPYQPESRLNVPEETARKFADSIQTVGLLQIPVVRQKGERFEVADGWLRLAGYKYLYGKYGLPWSEMPCIIREISDREMANYVMEANTVRKDLNPIDLARLYKKYLEDFKLTQVELAKEHNCSQGEIANTIRLLELPEDIQAKIISQEISETHGRQLLRLNAYPAMQRDMLAETTKHGYSVSQMANEVQHKIYNESESIDQDDYPKPEFLTADCVKCEHRVKIGTPYNENRKTWRCLNKPCYEKKTAEFRKEREEKIRADIAAAKKDGKKPDVLIVGNLTWRDYQELGSYHKIDNPEQCKSCESRAVGKYREDNDRVLPICINVKCFKDKEKIYTDKEAARQREAEKKLTERVKKACDAIMDTSVVFNIIGAYLLQHSRKDTRERFGRMYGIALADLPDKLKLKDWTMQDIRMLAGYVLTKERYEDSDIFKSLLATAEGKNADYEKELAAWRAKVCKGCRREKENCTAAKDMENNRTSCWQYSKISDKGEDDGQEEDE